MAAKKALTPYQAAAKKRAAAAKKTGSATGKSLGKTMTKSAIAVKNIKSSKDLFVYPDGDKDPRSSRKAGKDARDRASKSGTPEGRTRVYSSGQGNNRYVSSYTDIKSARGNKYEIQETKNQRPFGRDRDRITTITQTGKSHAGRDPKFGPAPKKKK